MESERLISDNTVRCNDDVIDDESRVTTRGYSTAFSAAFVCLSGGCVFSFTSPALPDILQHSFRLSSVQQAWTCSIVNVGAFVASLFGGRAVRALGWKLCLLSMVVLFVFGWLIIVAADGLVMLLVGRFVTGMCLGLCYILVPGYVAEITTAKVRDTVGASYALFIDLGILFVHFVGMFLTWRYLGLVIMVVLLVTMLLLLHVPESPRWLLSRGRNQEAIEALCWIRCVRHDHEVEAEFQLLQRHITSSATNDFSIKHLWSKGVLRPFLLSLILASFTVIPGIDYVWYFTQSIFEKSGVRLSPDLQCNLFGLSGVVGCVASVFVLGRFGRKQVLLVSTAFVVASLSALALFFRMIRDTETAAATRERFYWLPVTALFIYQLFYSLGCGPVPFLLLNELLPTRARPFASSLACSLMWLLVLLVTVASAWLAQDRLMGQDGLFWSFAALMLCALPFIVIFVPETKGKTLEDIEDYFLN